MFLMGPNLGAKRSPRSLLTPSTSASLVSFGRRTRNRFSSLCEVAFFGITLIHLESFAHDDEALSFTEANSLNHPIIHSFLHAFMIIHKAFNIFNHFDCKVALRRDTFCQLAICGLTWFAAARSDAPRPPRGLELSACAPLYQSLVKFLSLLHHDDGLAMQEDLIDQELVFGRVGSPLSLFGEPSGLRRRSASTF